jgi:unsaturated rhamnogalacturonyl hydrolase
MTFAASCAGQPSPQVRTDAPWSTQIAQSFVLRHPDAMTYDERSPDTKWNYEQGLMLVALYRMYVHSGDREYLDFIQTNLDHYVNDDGSINTYKRTDYNLDNIGPGRALLELYRATGREKFRAAADTLRQQLREQPRTHEGGFWHKKIYPYQMWLDGLFMAEPFYAQYATLFHEPSAFDDIANQFIWIAQHTRDARTGLFYHGWDESRTQRWADSSTGCSPNFWGRAMGWYAMGLVDVLDDVPQDHPERERLVNIIRDLLQSLVTFQDDKTGLWYQVIDQGDRAGNYLEASATCMFVYSMAKGVNKGYLDPHFLETARRAFQGVTEHLVTVDSQGFVDLHQICRSAGLGGNPYRDGSYEYYISEPQRTNDMKGYGPFLLAAIELEDAAGASDHR